MPSKRQKNSNAIKTNKTVPKEVTIHDFDAFRSHIQDLRDQFNFDIAQQELLTALKQSSNDVRLLDMLGEVYVENADPGHAVQVNATKQITNVYRCSNTVSN
jgi:hypothetical protein